MSAALSSPHLPVQPTVAGLMRRVLIALLPGIAAMVICFGIGVLSNVLIAVAAALATEAVLLRLRQRPVTRFIGDWTAVLTAVLFALALPPLAPWWLTVTGSALAIVLGKQLYGGLGQNPFNPAMVGYVVVLISFPTELTYWTQQAIAPVATLQAQWLGVGIERIDALTGATPLDALRSGLAQDKLVGESLTDLAGRSGWLWINLAFLAGGLWLCWRRDISWRIPVAVLAGLGTLALLPWLFDADRYASPLFHWTTGAAMLGAFFIATDPVSGATTPRGKLIFGAGIGLLVYIIRTWGGYPDGMAFAVLLMNLTVPLLDAHTQPRVYGL